MWDSNGHIDGKSVTVVDSGPGDMRVSGTITNGSFVYLVSTNGNIVVDGLIIENSTVILVSKSGNITIGEPLSASDVTLKAEAGTIDIGIVGTCQVSGEAGGDITVHGLIHGSTVSLRSHGIITTMGDITGDDSNVWQIADSNILLQGNIDLGSRVDLVSNRDSVIIYGKLDGESKVSLTAKNEINIGDGSGNGEDRKIDGNCCVTALAGGFIYVQGRIAKDQTHVDLVSGGNIEIDGGITNKAKVRLLALEGPIEVPGGLRDSGTTVTWYVPHGAPGGSDFNPSNDGATLTRDEWVVPEWARALSEWAVPGIATGAPDLDGYWWENYPQTFGYVAPFRLVPRSVDAIAAAIGNAGIPVKAIGGGYSFSDVALPHQTPEEVHRVSTQLRGAWQQQDMRHVLEGLNVHGGLKDIHAEPMDLLPQAVGRNQTFSTTYDQPNLRQVTKSGSQLPGNTNADGINKAVLLIDTRSLASSLQEHFQEIKGANTVRQDLFHVEAGITMADLHQLLDHQQPRMAIDDSSTGPSGATLAGVLSTCTHGAAFGFPVLADRVRAVHLVGAGGQQWWIEGDEPVADQTKLQLRYPTIDKNHFIAGGWAGIPGLTSQDVLDAVTVSMGTIGVIYSVVLKVVPQFAVHQVVHPTNWKQLLADAPASEKLLLDGDVASNQNVLNLLQDGTHNGTGIVNNSFAHLRINPFNGDCWLINQETTPLPDDENNPSVDFLTPLSRALSSRAADTVHFNRIAGRLFDFLSWATDDLDIVGSNLSQGMRLLNFITAQGDLFGGTLAPLTVQAIANVINNYSKQDRGQQFLADLVSGLFHGLHGTGPGQNSDITGVPYKFAAIGWPSRGIPGRAIEVVLDPSNAFTFLQTLFEDVFNPNMSELSHDLKPLMGYIAVRVCQPTRTLMGMQQYSPFSVTIEVAGYRSPEANIVMDLIQKMALSFSTTGPKPLLHWGLENDQVTGAYLAGTPLGETFNGGPFTRLEAFTKIRNFLGGGNPIFNNWFANRLGL